MSRLPSITPAQMVRALKRAGFAGHHQKGSHLYLWNAKRKLMTSVAMHGKDLPRGTMKSILEQADISEEAFRELL